MSSRRVRVACLSGRLFERYESPAFDGNQGHLGVKCRRVDCGYFGPIVALVVDVENILDRQIFDKAGGGGGGGGGPPRGFPGDIG